jgi:hypothetical protein
MSDAALIRSFHTLLSEAWSGRTPWDEDDYNRMNDDVQDIILTTLEIYVARVGPSPRPGRHSAFLLEITAACARRQALSASPPTTDAPQY